MKIIQPNGNSVFSCCQRPSSLFIKSAFLHSKAACLSAAESAFAPNSSVCAATREGTTAWGKHSARDRCWPIYTKDRTWSVNTKKKGADYRLNNAHNTHYCISPLIFSALPSTYTATAWICDLPARPTNPAPVTQQHLQQKKNKNVFYKQLEPLSTTCYEVDILSIYP